MCFVFLLFLLVVCLYFLVVWFFDVGWVLGVVFF